jgi:hypothetical protein
VRTQRWEALLGSVNASLYEWDPSLMGSKVGAPPNEYESEATTLISRLQHARRRSAFEDEARQAFPSVPDVVVDRWWAAFCDYWGRG